MYSLLPGGLEALPRFDDSDFKLPSEARTSISCFGVTRTMETESDDSDSDSPRHHRANGETPVCTPLAAETELTLHCSVRKAALQCSTGFVHLTMSTHHLTCSSSFLSC